MVLLILALLIAGEVVTAYGGLWLVFYLGREVHWLAGAAVLTAIVPAGWWLGDRILKVFAGP